MDKNISFSSSEKEFSHLLRSRINHSEDAVDLGNYFSATILEMNKSIAAPVFTDITREDILFSPSGKHHYSISDRLSARSDFRGLWFNSDLPSIIERFAQCVNHHYVHLAGHPEKTVLKIRNG